MYVAIVKCDCQFMTNRAHRSLIFPLSFALNRTHHLTTSICRGAIRRVHLRAPRSLPDAHTHV